MSRDERMTRTQSSPSYAINATINQAKLRISEYQLQGRQARPSATCLAVLICGASGRSYNGNEAGIRVILVCLT
jgi:hypothetical protein